MATNWGIMFNTFDKSFSYTPSNKYNAYYLRVVTNCTIMLNKSKGLNSEGAMHGWVRCWYAQLVYAEACAGGEYVGKEHAGKKYAGEEYAGEEYAGEEYADEEYAGEECAGEEHAGEEYAGEEYAC